jgi:hypothetical protein
MPPVIAPERLPTSLLLAEYVRAHQYLSERAIRTHDGPNDALAQRVKALADEIDRRIPRPTATTG